MKNTIVISFSIIVIILIIAGIIGFSYFNKRLTESKAETGKNIFSLPSQESKKDMGAVETSLPLQIISPSDQSTVTSAFITLRGKTTAQAEVFVNDKETNADPDGNFSVQLELEEGENPIMVVANDANGNVGEKEITLMYEIQEQKENLENLVASAGAVKVWIRTRTGLLKATMTAIGTNSLTVKTEDGKEYTVQIDNTTQWRRKFWGKSGLDETSVNDVLNVHGKWMNEERSQIQATLIRNMSIQKRNGVFFGTVKTLTSGGWVMTTVGRGDQMVTVSGGTRFIDRTGNGIGQSAILVGHRVRVMGLWDSKNNTITEVSQVKDFDLPAKPTVTPKP